MSIKKLMKLHDKYLICPDCGNDKLGNESGGVYSDDKVFKRYCKCGFKVTVKVDNIKEE